MSLADQQLSASAREPVTTSIPADDAGALPRTHITEAVSTTYSDVHTNLQITDDSDSNMIAPQHSTTAMLDVETEAPALPVKSARRASRMLDVTMHTLKMAAEAEQQPPFPQTAPHDVYLSSEEDASSSADDFSDFEEFDSGSEDASPESVKRRHSHEDTARVVSVVFAGKPSIVDLPRRSVSPSASSQMSSAASTTSGSSRPPSSCASHPPSRLLRRTSTDPMISIRRLSVSSSASSSILHPPRTSSMSPALNQGASRKLEKQRPQFLSIDPFASSRTDLDAAEHSQHTPKTPTAMFKRTLSLVRKKSKPALHQAFTQSRDNLALTIPAQQHMEQVEEEMHEEPHEHEQRPPTRDVQKPATYQEIIKSAKRRTQTQPISSPMSPMSDIASPLTPSTPNGTRSRLRNGFNAARRRSIKA